MVSGFSYSTVSCIDFFNLNGGLFLLCTVYLTDYFFVFFFLVITGFIIWSWLGLWAPGREQIAKKSTSKTRFNYSVESVGHGELVLFCKFFTTAREYTPLTMGHWAGGT